MRPGRSLWILGAACALAVAAALWSHRRPPPEPVEGGGLALPGLAARVNDAAEIVDTHAGETFSVKLDGDRWVVPEKSAYPADPAAVRSLLVGLAELKKLERKTRNAELHPQLGLDDPSAPGSTAVHLAVKSAGGDVLAAFKLGTRRAAKVDPGLTEAYFLEDGGGEAWLVEGRVGDIDKATDLLDRRLAEIDASRIKQVSIEHPGDVPVTIRKESQADRSFTIADAPEGHEANQYAVDDIGRALQDLELTDVMAASAVPAWEARQSVEFTTFDGLEVRMEVMPQEGADPRIRLSAAAVPATELGEGVDPAKAQEEAAALSARWANWVFVVPDYRISAVVKKRSDLLRPIASESQGGSG
jgi:hypothetical protein